MGKRIRLFNNLDSSSKYKLCLELYKKDSINKPLSIIRHIYTNDIITEIKLIDFEDSIKNLFGYLFRLSLMLEYQKMENMITHF